MGHPNEYANIMEIRPDRTPWSDMCATTLKIICNGPGFASIGESFKAGESGLI
jgi:hypothetical protein